MLLTFGFDSLCDLKVKSVILKSSSDAGIGQSQGLATVMFKYAQCGTTVPLGMSFGYLSLKGQLENLCDRDAVLRSIPNLGAASSPVRVSAMPIQ